MGKTKRAMNPADALRKQQRKRELKKNKEDRKRARESILAKKDIGRVKQDITRLEHLDWSHLNAQAAFVARMQEQEKKHEGEARKLVYDSKKGAFVPAKKKGK
ncbi:WW domain binding protein 11-domain-containing protein [Pilobolus umbonatus]|nr:WW domain binding protein 11-domain-containing protein [Pilobolus umbonatus]